MRRRPAGLCYRRGSTAQHRPSGGLSVDSVGLAPSATAGLVRLVDLEDLKPRSQQVPPAPTGIDYAELIDTAHQTELAHGVNYAALSATPIPAAPNPNGVLPGQLDLFTGHEAQLTTPADNDNDGQVTS